MPGPWEKYAAPPAEAGPWAKYAPSAPAAAPVEPVATDPTGSFLENVAAGSGKAIVDAARAVRQMATGATRAAPYAVPEVLRFIHRAAPIEQSDIDEARRLDAPLMDTVGGKVGNIGTKLAALFVPGANTYAGAAASGAALGALEPTATGESRALNTAVGGGGGVAGKFVGDKVAAGVQKLFQTKLASETARQAADAGRNAAAAAGRDAGYVVPPTQANPTTVNRVLEGVAGKLTTAQQASAKNQQVTNRLTRLGLGLRHDEPITEEVLAAVRARAGKAYERLGKGKFAADETFQKGVEGLAVAQKRLAEEFPELASKDVLTLAERLKRDTFDGETLVELTKTLREKAGAAFAKGETGAARFYKGAAREVEDLMERNIAYTGAGGPNALKEFRAARQLIAKAHAAEKALNKATGDIDAGKFADMLRKGKRLSDEFKTVGEFAAAFPKAAQRVDKMGSLPGTSPLDYTAAGIFSGLAGNPALMATVAARPAVRSTILSDAFQKYATTPSYGPGVTLSAANAAAQSEITKRIVQVLGAQQALEAAR